MIKPMIKITTGKCRRSGKICRLNIWKWVYKFRTFIGSDKSKFSNGSNFPNTFLYIRAAAGRSVWNQGLSLLSACGYFFAPTCIFSHKNSSDK